MDAGRKGARWWGVAAGIVLTGAAAAQPYPAASAPGGALASMLPQPRPAPEVLARLSEIKVQLAWLADPTLASCPLEIRGTRGALEIRGTVPHVQARARALEIARTHSELSVVDALSVGIVTVPHVQNESPARLNLETTVALMEPEFPGIKDLEVQAHPDGRIVLLGSTGSHEEKLLASQRVRKLGACTCVENRLEIRAGGRGLCAVSTDGRLVVPVETTRVPHAAAAAIAPARTTVKADASIRVDPAVTRALFELKPAPGFTVSSVAIRAGATPTTASNKVVPVEPVRKAEPVPCRLPLPCPTTLPAAPAPAEMPTIVATPTSEETRPAGETPSPVEAKPVIAVALETPALQPTEAASPTTVEPPAPGSLGDWYRQRIARECDLDPDCVFVEFPAPSDIAVTLRIVDRAAAGRLCTKVTRISELAPYHVKIEVQTSPHP